MSLTGWTQTLNPESEPTDTSTLGMKVCLVSQPDWYFEPVAAALAPYGIDARAVSPDYVYAWLTCPFVEGELPFNAFHFIGAEEYPMNSAIVQRVLGQKRNLLIYSSELDALPLGVTASSVAPSPTWRPHRLTITACAHDSDEQRALTETFAGLQHRYRNFDVRIFTKAELLSRPQLRAILEYSDVFIDGLFRDSLDILGAYALSQGVTVLGPNHGDQRDLHAPIFDTTAENLERRIESILREPKCLRDLARRSHTYAQVRYPVSSLVSALLRTYGRETGEQPLAVG